MITDHDFASLTQAELESIFFDYMDRVCAVDFKICKKDLSQYNEQNTSFVEDLTKEEIWIIAYGMLLAWLESKIKTERLLREAISTKDYTETSHANQLDKLLEMQRMTKYQMREYLLSYSKNDWEGFY